MLTGTPRILATILHSLCLALCLPLLFPSFTGTCPARYASSGAAPRRRSTPARPSRCAPPSTSWTSATGPTPTARPRCDCSTGCCVTTGASRCGVAWLHETSARAALRTRTSAPHAPYVARASNPSPIPYPPPPYRPSRSTCPVATAPWRTTSWWGGARVACCFGGTKGGSAWGQGCVGAGRGGASFSFLGGGRGVCMGQVCVGAVMAMRAGGPGVTSDDTCLCHKGRS